MLKKVLLAASLVIAVALVAIPLAAANNVPTTGTRIGLFTPPATFTANTHFNIEQGFACGPQCVN